MIRSQEDPNFAERWYGGLEVEDSPDLCGEGSQSHEGGQGCRKLIRGSGKRLGGQLLTRHERLLDIESGSGQNSSSLLDGFTRERCLDRISTQAAARRWGGGGCPPSPT